MGDSERTTMKDSRKEIEELSKTATTLCEPINALGNTNAGVSARDFENKYKGQSQEALMKLTFDLFCCLEKTTGAIAMLEEKIRHVEKEAEQAKKVEDLNNECFAEELDPSIKKKNWLKQQAAEEATRAGQDRTQPIPVSLDWYEIQEYERAFKDFDQNGDGIITVDELPEVLDSIGLKPSPEEVECMVATVDVNHDGIIDICEFIRMMSLQQNPTLTPEVQLEDVFRIFDRDGSGFITRDVLRSILLSLAHPVTEEEIDAMMKLGDRRGEGRLTKFDFIQLMTNKRL